MHNVSAIDAAHTERNMVARGSALFGLTPSVRRI